MNETMRDLVEQRRTGALSPAEFREKMHEHYRRLNDYAALLVGSEIAKIEVSAGCVLLVSREGLRFAFDPEDRRAAPLEALHFGQYEAGDAELFWSLLAPDQTVIDVGAHVGWYALHAARRFPTSRIHAFEPVPGSFELLERNVVGNELTNVTVYPVGLADQAGEMQFFVDAQLPTAASSVNLTGHPNARRESVSLRRLDDFDLTPDVVKIDVEGAELAVLCGATQTLARCQPGVFCEMLRKWNAVHGMTPNDTIELMRDSGYECVYWADGHLYRLARMTDETTATNFLFLHAARHADMLSEAL